MACCNVNANDPNRHAVSCTNASQYRIHRRMEVYRGAMRLLAAQVKMNEYGGLLNMPGNADMVRAVKLANSTMDCCESLDAIPGSEVQHV